MKFCNFIQNPFHNSLNRIMQNLKNWFKKSFKIHAKNHPAKILKYLVRLFHGNACMDPSIDNVCEKIIFPNIIWYVLI
jgi:iron-sulfur cluster repair protein YtfE (RIC family)